MFGGLKGVYRGEGYEYGKSLTSLGRFLRKLQKLDKPNTEIIGYLDILSQKIDKSKMSQNKKTALKDLIDSVKKEFNEYQAELDDVINKISSNTILQPTNNPQPNQTPPTP
jgi:oligoendopeptidase F